MPLIHRSSITGRFIRAPRGIFAWVIRLFSVRETVRFKRRAD